MIDIDLPRSLLFQGLFVVIGAALVFYGGVYLLLLTDLGKKLGFLVAGTALSGWLIIQFILYTLYAPRGPRQRDFEGLNSLEFRLVPITYLICAVLLFGMFLTALHRYESQERD